MKVYYWSPFISHVATVTSVINSVKAINKFSKKNIEVSIINVFKEWSPYNDIIIKNKIKTLELNTFLDIKNLPKGSFFKSRLTYFITFIFSTFKLDKLLKEEKPDFLIIHLITFIPLFLMAIFSYKTKFILRISGFPKLNFFRKILWKLSNKKIYKIFCPTELTKEILIKNNIFDIEKIFVVKDPIIDVNEFQIKKNDIIDKSSIYNQEYIISIGRLTKQKNFLFLVNAFKHVLLKLPNINLVILGEGEDRFKIQKKINDNFLNGKIILAGEKKNIYPYLNKAVFFVLTSDWEDPGFVILETMFSRKIVLSSDCMSGPVSIINNGQNGFLYKRNNLYDFCEKFFFIYKNIINNNKEFKKILFEAMKETKSYTLLHHFNLMKIHLMI
jgi:glycosyltransferase involved in cell wall biosynthesis